jgi:hypothetical protein
MQLGPSDLELQLVELENVSEFFCIEVQTYLTVCQRRVRTCPCWQEIVLACELQQKNFAVPTKWTQLCSEKRFEFVAWETPVYATPQPPFQPRDQLDMTETGADPTCWLLNYATP